MKRMCAMFCVLIMSFIVAMLFYIYSSRHKFQLGIKVRERVYSMLEEAAGTYRNEFSQAFTGFQKDNHKFSIKFNIPFSKFMPVFELPDVRTNVYAALGHGAPVIGRLVKIPGGLTFDHTTRDTKLAYDFLYLLKEITEPIDEILNGHLSDANLNRMSINKDVGTISIIIFNLKKAAAREKDLVAQVMGRMLAIDLTGGRQIFLQKLKSVIYDGI
ncbi:hypothetical protein [Borrelia hermsii]|nr:hypothetical protein [Borrelia hermsii]UPA08507.1 hypothetical protein bhDAH_001215 [Borrelia hermsii DAH]